MVHRIWRQSTYPVSLGAGWNEDGLFKMTPTFLACPTGDGSAVLRSGRPRKDWVCRADPVCGGRQLRHPNGDGMKVTECTDLEHRVRFYRDWFRAPEGS